VIALRQTWQVALRGLRVYARQPAYLWMTLTQPIIWLLLFGALFKAITQIPGFHGGSYIDFLTPGIVVMLAVSSAGWTGMALIEDIHSGVMDRQLASPVWRGALNAGEEGDGEVACVAPRELPELLLGPIDDERHHRGCLAIRASLDLVELGAERPHRAAVTRDYLAHIGPVSDERLQPCPRRAVALERLDQHRGLRLVAGDDGADELVLGLEVVVDVPERDVGAFGDLGEGRAVDALFMEQRPGALDEPIPLAWPGFND